MTPLSIKVFFKAFKSVFIGLFIWDWSNNIILQPNNSGVKFCNRTPFELKFPPVVSAKPISPKTTQKKQ